MSHVEYGNVLGDLRKRRSALRCELASVGHWRRLVQARIDLTVARGATPAQLHDNLVEPPTQYATLRLALEELPQVNELDFALSSLPTLRNLDGQLAAYETDLRRELMALTDQLVEHLAVDATLHPFGG